MIDPDYAHWQAMIAGDDASKTARHEGDYQCGFYRTRGGEPVAIYRDEAGSLCGSDGIRPVSSKKLEFLWASLEAVTENVWRSVAEEGKPWPDHAPHAQVAVGRNMPADPAEAVRLEIDSEAAEIERFLREPIRPEDEDRASRAAAWADRFSELEKRADALRAERKRPHDDAAKAIQAEWKPVVDKAAQCKRDLKDAVTPFLREKARREAAARADALAADRAPEPARPVNVGPSGRKVSMRTIRVARIVDYDAALMALKDTPDMRALVATLANHVIRAGGVLPGIEIDMQQQAA